MSDPSSPRSETASHEFSAEEMQSALFAQLVMQQSSMAMMLMGQSPHPETGKTMRDLDAAQMFIGQLEMLEAKTRGNLTKTEESLLKQTLMALRMAFVEAAEKPQPETQPQPQIEPKPAETAGGKNAPAPEPPESEESKKRFSKKFSL